MVKKENKSDPISGVPVIESRPGQQTAFRDIKLMGGCLKFLTKIDLDRIPIVAPSTIMITTRSSEAYNAWNGNKKILSRWSGVISDLFLQSRNTTVSAHRITFSVKSKSSEFLWGL